MSKIAMKNPCKPLKLVVILIRCNKRKNKKGDFFENVFWQCIYKKRVTE